MLHRRLVVETTEHIPNSPQGRVGGLHTSMAETSLRSFSRPAAPVLLSVPSQLILAQPSNCFQQHKQKRNGSDVAA